MWSIYERALPVIVASSVFVVTFPNVSDTLCKDAPGGRCEVGAFTVTTSTGYDGSKLVVEDTMGGDVITFIVDRREFPAA